MSAREIVAALGGRWHGSYGLALCPAHDDGKTPALSIGEGEGGKVLIKCHAGCDQMVVINTLRRRGLWSGTAQENSDTGITASHDRARERAAEEAKRRAAALEIWRGAEPAGGTPVETYLRFRGIKIDLPPTLRFLRGAKHGPTGLIFGAMVAAIGGLDRQLSAVHRTFLNVYGSGKAGVRSPKLALGLIGSGSVHLGPAGVELGIAEGIETGLSAMQLFQVSVWCACGSWLERVAVPASVSKVIIFADNGEAGEQAAEKAARVHIGAGRAVDVRFPTTGKDWNDVLQARTAERAA